MGKSVFLGAVLMLLGGVAFAEHAISPEPEMPAEAPVVVPAPKPEAPAAVAEPEAATAAPEQPSPKVEPTQAVTVVPAPKVEVTLPAEHDVYLVPAATREVCTTYELGFGEIQTDCRMQPIQARSADPALRGVCITRYGRRSCY